MNKEDMVRMIESGEKLPDYCQEEIDKLLFKEIGGKYVKIHIKHTTINKANT
jgi:hypothetical protein